MGFEMDANLELFKLLQKKDLELLVKSLDYQLRQKEIDILNLESDDSYNDFYNGQFDNLE